MTEKKQEGIMIRNLDMFRAQRAAESAVAVAVAVAAEARSAAAAAAKSRMKSKILRFGAKLLTEAESGGKEK